MLFNLKKRLKGAFRGDIRVTRWDAHRLLYVRLPKNANTSIRAAIEGGTDTRLSARRILALDDQWTTFSFVRNPWSRLVSVYVQKVSERATSRRIVDGVYQGFVDSGIAIEQGMDFASFCELVCGIPDEKTDKHLRSQVCTLVRNGEPLVRFIGKVESMRADWDRLMTRTGLAFELPHSNRTSATGEHYSSYYADERLVRLVAERYAADINYFGYEFERK